MIKKENVNLVNQDVLNALLIKKNARLVWKVFMPIFRVTVKNVVKVAKNV